MKKKLLISGGIILALLIGAFLGITNGLSEGAQAAIIGIDLKDVADGSYIGAYEFKRWSNTVAVKVKDHKITEIDVMKDVIASQITNCSGEVFRRVIEAQNTTIDTVSGATVTSKAYLKAIEDAFKR